MSHQQVVVKSIDLNTAKDCEALLTLLSNYAKDPMGGGEALPESTKANLIAELKQQTIYTGFIAWIDEQPVGLANCMAGFSSFYAKKILNIHDFAVEPDHRGKGIGKTLMKAVIDFARQEHYAKVTLEVLTGNEPARQLYLATGFAPYQLDESKGIAEFWQQAL